MHVHPRILALFLLCAFLVLPLAHAQEAEPVQLDEVKTRLSTMLPRVVVDSLLERLFTDPEGVTTLNRIWKDTVLPESSFLRSLNLEFQTFKAEDVDSTLGLGFTYSISDDLKTHRLDDNSQAGLSLSFASAGNVAFEPDINPEDFLEAEFSFHLFKSWGGTIAARDEVFTRLNELETEVALITDPDELLAAPALQTFDDLMRQYIQDQLYFDVSLTGGLEADQAFSTTQYTFGARLGIDLNLWRNGYLNVFDWPFAAIRSLSGYDRTLDPRGGQFPITLLTLERIHPVNHPAREMLGATSDFTRFSAEVAFKTEVASSSYFEANLRYYKELDAPQVVKDAALDEHMYFTVALTAPNNVFVSYTTGKLPFDAADNQIYQLGFKYNF